MKTKFDKDGYFELLKELKLDFDEVKRKKKSEYLISLEADIHWKNRFEYLQILNLFINEVITMNEFTEQFMTLHFYHKKLVSIYKKNLEAEAFSNLGIAEENKIDLYVDSRSIGFVTPIVRISNYLEIYNPNIDLSENLKYPDLIAYGASEGYIRKIVKELYLPDVASYCNEF